MSGMNKFGSVIDRMNMKLRSKSGHNFLVQRMRHDRNRRPYELMLLG